jgi:hypothetical protein
MHMHVTTQVRCNKVLWLTTMQLKPPPQPSPAPPHLQSLPRLLGPLQPPSQRLLVPLNGLPELAGSEVGGHLHRAEVTRR